MTQRGPHHDIIMIWISATHVVGLKKISLVLLGLSIVLITSYTRVPLLAVFAGATLFWFIIVLAHEALTQGIFIRRETITINNHNYDVIDRLFPLQRSENYREIRPPNDNFFLSRIYFHQDRTWAFFNNIRRLLDAVKKPQIRNALILGGGGGAMAIQLARRFPNIHIDVVEKYPAMVRAAKTYFVPKNLLSHTIVLHCTDALRYITRTLPSYDFIFLDVFDHDIVPKTFRSPLVVKKTKSLVSPRGIFILNCGFKDDSRINETIYAYRAVFPDFRVFRDKGGILGLGTKNHEYIKALNTLGISIL